MNLSTCSGDRGYYMITYAYISEKGSRPINEDSLVFQCKDGNFCFLIADELGGHGRGEIASGLVSEQTVECFEKNGKDTDFISKTFENCQAKLLAAQKQLHAVNEMKTTMVLCTIREGILNWGHIGDSRLYIFVGRRLKKRTLDHSVPQMLAAAREIKEKEIRFHPDRNRLLKVMGTDWNGPEYEIGGSISVNSKISLLMCTDGFWELIDEKGMARSLRRARTVQEWITDMKKTVEQEGRRRDMDNYSAIGIWCR